MLSIWSIRPLRLGITITITIAIALGTPLVAPQALAEERAIEVYKGVESTPQTPTFPRKMVDRGVEGFVILNYMVDPQGRPYEVEVVESTHGGFNQNAVRAIELGVHKPATLKGVPIDSGQSWKFTYTFEGPVPARTRYAADFRRFEKALAKGRKAKAAELLRRLSTSRNLREYRMQQIARYQYLRAAGAPPLEMLAPLENAIHTDGELNVDLDVVLRSLITLYRLQVQVSHYGDALETFAKIESLAVTVQNERGSPLAPELVAQLSGWRDTIFEIKDGNEPFGVNGEIAGGTNSWGYRPLRTRFRLEDLSHETPHRAAIAEVKLRCERGYVFFRYEPDMQYDFSGNGLCMLHLVGNPGTRFRLVEL